MNNMNVTSTGSGFGPSMRGTLRFLSAALQRQMLLHDGERPIQRGTSLLFQHYLPPHTGRTNGDVCQASTLNFLTD